MRFAAISFALVFAAWSFYPAPAAAGHSRRAQMSGYDMTYHSTGRCFQGMCRAKNPHSRRVWPSHQR